MSSILFTKARFAFFSELFDILQYSAVAVTIPSIVPMINEFFICLPPNSIVCTYALLMYGKLWQRYNIGCRVINCAVNRVLSNFYCKRIVLNTAFAICIDKLRL